MKIIIDIPEEMIEAAKTDLWCSSPTLGYAIKKSIPYKERPHGEWIEVKQYNRKCKRFLDCSVCHYGEKGEIVCEVTKIPNFCPNCGADMRPKEGESK